MKNVRIVFRPLVRELAAKQTEHRKQSPRNTAWQGQRSCNRDKLRALSLAYAFARGVPRSKVEPKWATHEATDLLRRVCHELRLASPEYGDREIPSLVVEVQAWMCPSST